MICIKNACVLTPMECIEGKTVVIDKDKIFGLCDTGEIPQDAEVIDAQGLYLAPGFIDLHVHGGGGYGVMSLDAQKIALMCEAHAAFGSTSILPTTLAEKPQKLKEAICAVKEARRICNERGTSNILGVHLEGPFLSRNQRGAQSEDSILVPEERVYLDLLNTWDKIRIMGAAPEVSGALGLGRELRRRGILASVAHSDATYEDCLRALESGYSDITHIYSGCSTVIRKNGFRIAGVVEAGLGLDDFTVQVIADMKHLPSALLRLIYKCKGAGKMALITDGLDFSASSLEEGTIYEQENGVKTLYEDGVMKLLDRQAFAGSVATMDCLVFNMYHTVGIPLLDAVRMATLTPAKMIKEAGKGMIAPGFDADIVLFDEDIRVSLVMISGVIKLYRL